MFYDPWSPKCQSLGALILNQSRMSRNINQCDEPSSSSAFPPSIRVCILIVSFSPVAASTNKLTST